MPSFPPRPPAATSCPGRPAGGAAPPASRLLDAAAGLLETNTYRDLKVVDIARVAGTSPATFYQYFSDVEEAVLALAEEVELEAGGALADLVVDRAWSGAEGWATSLALADGFVRTWERYRSVLRVIDLATDEGDQRFRGVRTRMLGAPSEALVAVLQRPGRAGGRRPRRGRACWCRCSPTSPPTGPGSSSGGPPATGCARAWPASCSRP